MSVRPSVWCQHLQKGSRILNFGFCAMWGNPELSLVARDDLPDLGVYIMYQFVEFYLYPTVGTVLIHSVKPELTE